MAAADIEQRQVNVLALLGALTLLQRRQDGDCRVQARRQIDDRHAHLLRAAASQRVGPAGDAHQAAHALDHCVVAGARCVGSGLTETGDRAIDEPRIEPG